jgi:23S rRNA maturation mini-RNase III
MNNFLNAKIVEKITNKEKNMYMRARNTQNKEQPRINHKVGRTSNSSM